MSDLSANEFDVKEQAKERSNISSSAKAGAQTITLTTTELHQLLQNQVPEAPQGDDIELAEVLGGLIRHKWLILVLALSASLLMLLVSFAVLPKYESSVLIVPVTKESASSSLLAKYGGLAGMAGVSLSSGSEGMSTSQEALAILQTTRFLSEFIKQYDLKKILFYQSWDESNHVWLRDESFWAGVKGIVKSYIFSDNMMPVYSYEGKEVLAAGEPSMLQAVSAFRKNMTVSDDKKTGLITIKITWINPVDAKQWANELVRRVDEELRQKAIMESQNIIKFIDEKLPEIQLNDVRLVALNMIEEHVKKITFAKVNPEFVFKVIDPAVVPEKPVSPKRALMVMFGFVLGLILGVFLSLLLNWKSSKKNFEA